jgi:hypothetical protein
MPQLLWFTTLTVAMQKANASLLPQMYYCAQIEHKFGKKYFYWGSVIAVLVSKTPATEHRHLNE